MASKPKLTDEQKRQRRHERCAKKTNEGLRESMPLFAEMFLSTPELEFWRWRKNVSEGVERVQARIFSDKFDDWFTIPIIENAARCLIGDDAVFSRLHDKCRRTYPHSGYYYGYWKNVLCGERIELPLRKAEDRQPGQPAVVCDAWYQCQHMTTEEFYRRFPYKDETPLGHNDQELWRKLQAIFSPVATQG